jgi:hypothetical protein
MEMTASVRWKPAQPAMLHNFRGTGDSSSKSILMKEKTFPPSIQRQAVDGRDRSGYCDFEGKGIEPLPSARTRTRTSRPPVGDVAVRRLSQELHSSTTTVPGVICFDCQLIQQGKEGWRLTDEEPHIR